MIRPSRPKSVLIIQTSVEQRGWHADFDRTLEMPDWLESRIVGARTTSVAHWGYLIDPTKKSTKIGNCSSKSSPLGVNYLFFSFRGTVRFSVGPLSFEQTVQTLEMILIRPYRLWKELCSDYLDHTAQLSRPSNTLWSDYPDSGRGSD